MRTKYPRTFHFPWSPGRSDDDKVHAMEVVEVMFSGKKIVVTEKLDGENTTVYPDGTCHARGVDSRHHSSRDLVKRLAASVGHEIPARWRVCGENVYARHSIAYHALPSFFMVFALFDDQNACLSWDETLEWSALLGLSVVPELYRGPWDEQAVRACWTGVSRAGGEQEGYVARVSAGFPFSEFARSTAKYVRSGHVTTDEHWLRQPLVPNSGWR